MDLDLDRPMPKVTRESERTVTPAETVVRARDALGRLGLAFDAELWNRDDFVWVATVAPNFGHLLPPFARGVRVMGKGPSRTQCVASGAMELIERLSLYRYVAGQRREHLCRDLRDNREYLIADRSDLRDTTCVAAGNNYEEAILHALHELVETRLRQSCMWRPFKLVDFAQLDLAFPDWVRERFIVLKTPSEIDAFCHVTALRYPANGQFDVPFTDRVIKVGDRLFFNGARRPPNHHSPNSGGAGGLDPTSCALRAIGEALQNDRSDLDVGRRRPPPAFVEITTKDEVANHETDSITGDIRRILALLGDDTFVGIIDVADPDLRMPVVKLVSDWEPTRSVSSAETMSLFFDLEGRGERA